MRIVRRYPVVHHFPSNFSWSDNREENIAAFVHDRGSENHEEIRYWARSVGTPVYSCETRQLSRRVILRNYYVLTKLTIVTCRLLRYREI